MQVQRSYRSGKTKFYELPNYKEAVDLEEQLNGGVHFFNFHRPHGVFERNTPYEALHEKL